jgi:Helicase conserved C-terminal domain
MIGSPKADQSRITNSPIRESPSLHFSAKVVLASEDEDDETEDEERSAEPVRQPLVACLANLATRLPDPRTLEEHDTKFAEFLTVVHRYLAENRSEKLIVFSSFKATIAYLRRRLAAANLLSAVIHGDVEDREGVLAHFATEQEPRILLSSEVGSEGLDLQFCRAIVNYDLPWNPMRVEQRIGRVDRMGQKADTVSIVNLLHEDTIDYRIYQRLYERLRLCESTLGEFEAVLGDEIRTLTEELLRGNLSTTEQEERIERASRVIERRRAELEKLEAEAGALFKHRDRILHFVEEARALNRFIGPPDLVTYITDALARFYTGCELRALDNAIWELRLSEALRVELADWMRTRRLAGDSRLVREAGPVRCRFGRPVGMLRGVESITQVHPLVRLLAERNEREGSARERPAIAAQLRANDVAGAITAGHYAISVQLWQFGGAAPLDRIAYAALNLEKMTLLSDEMAEALVAGIARVEPGWLEAEAQANLGFAATEIEGTLRRHLDARYSDAQAALRITLDDRANLQLRALDRWLEREGTNLEKLIERLRAEQRTRAIPANEGRLRHLNVRAEARRAQLELQRRTFTAGRETLAVALVKVT